MIVLDHEGKLYFDWKTIIPIYLQNEEYAWEVVDGSIDRSTGPDEKAKWIKGNRNARTAFGQSIEHRLFRGVFFEDSDIVEAADIWKHINDRFANTGGIFKDIAMMKFTNFQFDPNLSIPTNVSKYYEIVFELQTTGSSVKSEMLISRLLTSLPQSWEPFKQAYSSAQNKTLTDLKELILAESMRRNLNKSDE